MSWTPQRGETDKLQVNWDSKLYTYVKVWNIYCSDHAHKTVGKIINSDKNLNLVGFVTSLTPQRAKNINFKLGFKSICMLELTIFVSTSKVTRMKIM